MVESKIYSSKEAIEKGFLEDRKVYLKPVPRRGNKMITDPSHVGYFMWEGARKSFCLPSDKYGILVNPFKSEEEQVFLSKLLDIDLNPRKKQDNFWYTFYVSITKTPQFMVKGEEYNLADPMDNLRYRVLMKNSEIAPSWEERFERPYYKFAIVEEDYEEKSDNEEMEVMETIYTFWGSIKASPKKMREFLGVYLMHKRESKEIGKDVSKEFLTAAIQKAIKEDRETVYNLIKDENASIKYFIYKGIQVGAIYKKGVSTYYLIGEEKEYTLKELVEHIKFLKETTDPIYLKLEAQINEKK